MKHFPPLLLVLTLLLWCGACARSGIVVPEMAVPEEEALVCEVTKIRAELLHFEDELNQATEQRTNCLRRVARLSYLLGELSPRNEKNHYFEKGRRYSEILAQEQPDWVEGYYWQALNLCGLAEISGPRQGLKLVPEIIEKMEQALRINPAYEQAGPHRVLGRVYYECPGWPLSVGNLNESLKHLSLAVALAPNNSTNHLFLSETLLKLGKKEEAREALEKVLRATHHAHCPQHLEEDRQEALQLLNKKW